MELNIIEKILIKIFWGTFDKVYKRGLSDSFNFIKALSSTPDDITIEE